MSILKIFSSKLLNKDTFWWLLAAVLAVASVWIPSTPADSLELYYAIPLIFLGVSSFILGIFHARQTWIQAIFMISSVCIFRFIVIIIDSIKDPTSHNLMPFEILITGSYAFAVVFPSGYLGMLLRKIVEKIIKRKRNDERQHENQN